MFWSGEGAVGEIVDVFSGGFPKDIANGLLFGYGFYNSNVGKKYLLLDQFYS